MIQYQKAIKIINKISLNLPNEKISTLDSLNRVCSKNILSRVSFISRENIPSNLNSPERKYFGPVSLQKLKFQLVDQYNRIVDTNNIDFSFSLKLSCVYDM